MFFTVGGYFINVAELLYILYSPQKSNIVGRTTETAKLVFKGGSILELDATETDELRQCFRNAERAQQQPQLAIPLPPGLRGV